MTNAAAPGPIARTTAKSKNLALAAMLFAVSMTFIDQTIVAIASPNIQSELDLSRSGVQWVINGYILALAAGFLVQGNFSNLTSGVLMVAEPHLRGTTVAVYSCIGFAGGFVGTLLFGLPLDWFGEAAPLAAWAMAFGICAIACLVGGIATAFLSRDLGRESIGRRPE